MDGMTDKQFAVVLALIADKVEACKTSEDIEKVANEIRMLAEKQM